MRLAHFAFAALTAGWVYACAQGNESLPDNDDGQVITGVGGATSASASGTNSVSSSSNASSSSSSSGQGGQGAATCVNDMVHEPNENENVPFQLPAVIDECDSSGSTVSGVISGANDVDWYRYSGNNDQLQILCFVDPGRTLMQSQGGLELCKFFECKSGQQNTVLTCPGGTSQATSQEGRPGCCASQGFEVGDVECSGSADDDMFVFIRVSQPGGTATTCNQYTLNYHF